MNPDKSMSAGEHSFLSKRATTMGVTSRQKFQNVEKLTTIVKEMQQNSNRPAQPEQILQMIKTKIKSNYNNLYENYQQNKNLILKSIQQTETNDVGTMNHKFQSVLKQKNAYDKLKSEVQLKQRKLKKMLDLKQQITSNSQGREDLIATLDDRLQMIRMLEQHKNVLQYEAAVLFDMKKQREGIKLNIKQRQQNMLKQEESKKQRTKKIKDATHTKKILLGRIQQKIRQQDQCQIPLSLAQQLQKKLSQYQGKYTQQNILLHENRLSDEKAQYEKNLIQKQQETIRRTKLAKQKQDQREFDVAYNHYLLKQTEEQKIKRLCRVNQITDIANGSLEEEKLKLQKIKSQIEQQIDLLNRQNQQMNRQIQAIMTTIKDQKNDQNVNVLELSKQLDEQQSHLRRIKSHVSKKQNKVTQWETYLQLLFNGKCDRENMIDKLKNSIAKYEKYNIRQKSEAKPEAEARELRTLKSELNRKKCNNQTKLNNNYDSSQIGSQDIQF